MKVLSKKRKTTFNTSGKKKGTKRQATRSHGGSSKTEECQASEGGEPVFAGKRKVCVHLVLCNGSVVKVVGSESVGPVDE